MVVTVGWYCGCYSWTMLWLLQPDDAVTYSWMILWLLQPDDAVAVTEVKNKLCSGLGPMQSIGNNGGAQLRHCIELQSREGRNEMLRLLWPQCRAYCVGFVLRAVEQVQCNTLILLSPSWPQTSASAPCSQRAGIAHLV